MRQTLLERPGFVFVLLACMTALLLHACWHAPFYNVDDTAVLTSAHETAWMDCFTPKPQKQYTPLAEISTKIDCLIFAPTDTSEFEKDIRFETFKVEHSWAGKLRLTNGFYHLLAGFLLWLALRRLAAPAGGSIAVFVALAWTGHPMACESVCWISERKNVLMALFCFAAMLAWTAPREKRWRWPLVYALYAMALLSKPAALSLAPVLLALEITDPIQREFDVRNKSHWLRALKHLAPVALISICGIWITMHANQSDIVEPPGGTLFTAMLTNVSLLGRYVSHILTPLGLSFFYATDPILSLRDPRLWYYGLTLLLLFGGLIWIADKQRRPLAVLGLLWFIGALAPNSNIVATAFPIQDRFAYLASAGLLLALGAAGESIAAGRAHYRLALKVAGAAYIAILAASSAARSPIFNNSETLELDAAVQAEGSAFAQLCAARLCHAGLNHKMHDARPDRNLYLPLGKSALLFFDRALKCDDILLFSDLESVHTTKAEILLQMNMPELARKELEGWLPPPGIPLLPDNWPEDKPPTRRDLYRGYHSWTLAHGWALTAEASLQLSAAPGLRPDERMNLCKQALDGIEHSLKAHLGDYEGLLIKGRILMQTAFLDAENGNDSAAEQHFADAVRVLNSIPAQTSSAAQAREVLAHVKPPGKHGAPEKP